MKAVIFDMDGVLLDSEKAHYEAVRRVLARRGIFLTFKEWKRDYPGRPDAEAFFYVLKMGKGEAEKLAGEKQKILVRIAGSLAKPFKPTIAAAERLCAEGYALALGTSAASNEAAALLRRFGLKRLFPIVVTAEDVKRGKPAPDIYLLAAKKLKAKPKDCVVVEDSIMGVEAAKRAGIRCVAVTHTFPRKLLRRADAIVDDRGAGGSKKLFKAIAEQ